MKTILRIMVMAVACAIIFMAGSSQASFIGTVYQGDSTAAYNPSGGPTIAATDTFTVDAINFDTRLFGTTATYDQFLGGPGNVNNLQGLSGALTGQTIVTATDPLSPTPSPSIYGTFFQFTGTAFFPANALITHDDGFYLDLGAGGTFNFSAPVSPTNTFLGNAAGLYTFTLNYGAWNSFPEVLIVPNVAPIPEPGTMMLLGSGLVGLAGWGRKKFRR